MDVRRLSEVFRSISAAMTENTEYLTELDARFGDADLGISMRDGFSAVYRYISSCSETDLGMALRGCSSAFNEAAPSSLGTIISFGLMGMAKTLKGKTEATIDDIAKALSAGLSLIMDRAKSKPGEKTVLDSISPAIDALNADIDKGASAAFASAAKAAAAGLEETKNMVGKHGRIAYYGDKTLGYVDGGAAVGMLIFKAISETVL